MKKIALFILVAFLFSVVPLCAQQTKTKKPTLEEKVTKFVKLAKKDLEQAGHELGDAIGFEDRISAKSDLVKINGRYYMPLYDTNLYKGDSANVFLTQCKALFQKKYPKVKILTVTIPQNDWYVVGVPKTEDVNKIDDLQLDHFESTLHCFVLAKDGNEGYIHAKFTYAKRKKVGDQFQIIEGSWPKWERTDVMTNSVFDQLNNQ